MYVFSLLQTLEHLVSLFNTAWVLIGPHLSQWKFCHQLQELGCEHPRSMAMTRVCPKSSQSGNVHVPLPVK